MKTNKWFRILYFTFSMDKVKALSGKKLERQSQLSIFRNISVDDVIAKNIPSLFSNKFSVSQLL